MRYIDFDGVILDTEDVLFEQWRKNPDRKKLPPEAKINYIQNANWEKIVHESPEINDSLYILKQMNPYDSMILTKVHSLTNEAVAKVRFLQENGVKQKVICVPYMLNKTDMVIVKDNILIDDCLHNLTQWLNAGGYPMFFDKKGNNIDTWKQENTMGYQRVRKINEQIR